MIIYIYIYIMIYTYIIIYIYIYIYSTPDLLVDPFEVAGKLDSAAGLHELAVPSVEHASQARQGQARLGQARAG